MRWFNGLIKFGVVILLVGSFTGCIAVSPRPERPAPAPGPKIHPEDLRVLHLAMSPDPIRERQRVRFSLTLSNLSHHPGRVALFIKDRDETIAEAYDILLQPGHNRINFPETGYRFSRREHCFVVEVDIERTRRPVDVVKELCARRVNGSWTLSR